MKKLLITLVFFGCMNFLTAQDSAFTSKQKIKFQSFVQGGLLAGESKSAYHVETINGIKYKTFFGGVGVGIDNYKFRTIPFFVDLRKDIFNKPSTPFVFVDAGSQLQWLEDGQKHLYYSNLKYKGSFYFNAGAGYRISLTSKTAFTFNAAYSLKKVNELYAQLVSCPFDGPCVEMSPDDINKYSLKRLSLTAAITFW